MEKNASGTCRQTLRNSDQAAVQLTLDGQTWQLSTTEQGAVALFIDEMRRARNWRHERWCDPKAHKQAAEGAELDETPCVGRLLHRGSPVGGWWHQDEPGSPPRFHLDATGFKGWDAAPDELRAVQAMLRAGGGEQLVQLLTQALADFDGGER